MCKKLFVALVVLALCMPAMAAYIGFNEDEEPAGAANPLLVDITEGGAPKADWQGWGPGYSWTGPVSGTLNNPFYVESWEIPTIEIDAYKTGQDPANNGGSRGRSGGLSFVAGTGEYNATAKMFGMNYLKITLGGLAPETEYRIKLWSFEATNVWSANSANPRSKFGVWSTLNPTSWLTSNGYPNGYAPTEMTDGTSGMPEAMVDAMGTEYGRASVMADGYINDNNNLVGTENNMVDFYVTTSATGYVTVYGWIDPTDWAGSMHMPINGLMITPEPATIALLGLGGLALLRRKRS
ncbi:MAG: PEP-CTERM sorting domain-containing protein [Phycisphaerae bacterium]|nr:PEP-CTERM sorting domain-containing protein [Phycisphaerae bacterium]MDD5381990.1 PEP-CTERM sorting domain-containing protein [Phycisphaerae bacterium]